MIALKSDLVTAVVVQLRFDTKSLGSKLQSVSDGGKADRRLTQNLDCTAKTNSQKVWRTFQVLQ